MQSVFQFHNSERFEIYCYATTESDGSTYRSKIEMDAHHFVNVTSWSTQAVVEQVHRDGIHIRKSNQPHLNTYGQLVFKSGQP